MRINNVNFDCTMEEVLEKLQTELRHRGSPLLASYKRSKGFLMVPCVYHGNGVENHPSAEFAEDGSFYYCFTCKESHTIPEVITDCLHENGWNWLRKNFLNHRVVERSVEFNLSRGKKIKDKKETEEKLKYIDKSELDKYRYIHKYLLNRGISKEIIRKFDIGYDKEQDCITFPNKDVNGNILFFATRHTKKKRFHYPPGAKKVVYGLYEIKRELKKGAKIDEIYLTESMVDALTIWSWGKYAVALNGTGNSNQIKELNEFPCRTYVLATDNDDAGKKARDFLKKNLKNKILKQISYKSYGDCKDINDMTKEQFDKCRIIWA